MICPKCKSSKIIPIMYGYPAPKAIRAAEKGELELGGCVLPFKPMTSACKSCDYRFRKT